MRDQLRWQKPGCAKLCGEPPGEREASLRILGTENNGIGRIAQLVEQLTLNLKNSFCAVLHSYRKCPFLLTFLRVGLTYIVTETPHSTRFRGAPAVPRDDKPDDAYRGSIACRACLGRPAGHAVGRRREALRRADHASRHQDFHRPSRQRPAASDRAVSDNHARPGAREGQTHPRRANAWTASGVLHKLADGYREIRRGMPRQEPIADARGIRTDPQALFRLRNNPPVGHHQAGYRP
jgi:hypothetical protein